MSPSTAVAMATHISGRLIRPFSLLAPAGRAYYLVYPESRRNAPKIKMFRDWMLEATAFMRKES